MSMDAPVEFYPDPENLSGAFDHEEQMMNEQPAVPQIFTAINNVKLELAKTGIGKSRRNSQQGYDFRGIDDMYNVVGPLLAEHGIVLIPHFDKRDQVERETRNGGALFYVTVRGHFEFVSVADCSRIDAGPFYGEAMDTNDKATNKAQSASLKYCLMQVFTIPTKGDNDTENTTHDVAGRRAQPKTDPVLDALKAEAKKGMNALQVKWDEIGQAERKRLKDELDGLKNTAADFDAKREEVAA